jgi:hypothetical protein
MESEQSEKLNISDAEIEQALSELCCKKCFGRGYIGWTLSNDPVLCDCTRRAKKTLPLEAKSNE